MQFDWDEPKRESNLKKHGIDFLRAILVFEGKPYVYPSPRGAEKRFVAIGGVEGRVIAVVYTERLVKGETVIRIISARRARTNEERDYKARSKRK